MILTESQEIGKNKILSFLQGPDREMRITGAAGHGKTTMLRFALQDHLLKNPYDSIIGITVSHKAKAILGNSIPSVATFAKAYGYKEKIVGDKRIFEPDPFKIANALCKNDNKCFIIDECSMFSQEMLDILYKETSIFTKFIFVGDKNQLPPIVSNVDRGLDSPVFYMNLSENLSHELTEVVRQEADNPIVFVANEIAKEIQGSCNLNNIIALLNKEHLKDGVGIHVLPKHMIHFHYNENYSNDLLNNKIIGYRNNIIAAHNNTLRNLIYKNPQTKIIKGEVIFFNDTYMNENDNVMIENSSEYIIEDVMITNVDQIKSYMIYVNDNGSTKRFPIPTEDGEADYRQACEILYSDKKYKQYWDFKQQFANISPSFAITSYKSQGSTYKNVYIDLSDMLSDRIPISPKRRLQSLYTSLTRAKYNCYIAI
jgi:ATP-dependent exoDNAse (exonuclease V) alpha subunit